MYRASTHTASELGTYFFKSLEVTSVPRQMCSTLFFSFFLSFPFLFFSASDDDRLTTADVTLTWPAGIPIPMQYITYGARQRRGKPMSGITKRSIQALGRLP